MVLWRSHSLRVNWKGFRKRKSEILCLKRQQQLRYQSPIVERKQLLWLKSGKKIRFWNDVISKKVKMKKNPFLLLLLLLLSTMVWWRFFYYSMSKKSFPAKIFKKFLLEKKNKYLRKIIVSIAVSAMTSMEINTIKKRAYWKRWYANSHFWSFRQIVSAFGQYQRSFGQFDGHKLNTNFYGERKGNGDLALSLQSEDVDLTVQLKSW